LGLHAQSGRLALCPPCPPIASCWVCSCCARPVRWAVGERAQTHTHTHTPRATKKQQAETRAPRAKKKTTCRRRTKSNESTESPETLARRRQAKSKSNESTQNQKTRRATGKPNRKRARREPTVAIRRSSVWGRDLLVAGCCRLLGRPGRGGGGAARFSRKGCGGREQRPQLKWGMVGFWGKPPQAGWAPPPSQAPSRAP
jgi:hypothetical protein